MVDDTDLEGKGQRRRFLIYDVMMLGGEGVCDLRFAVSHAPWCCGFVCAPAGGVAEASSSLQASRRQRRQCWISHWLYWPRAWHCLCVCTRAVL